jgi:hypothetical protein
MAQLASFNILYTAARLIPISLARAVPIIPLSLYFSNLSRSILHFPIHSKEWNQRWEHTVLSGLKNAA